MNRQILRIAIPSIVSNVTVPLLGLVDLWISGHLGAVRYIGAIAVGSMVFNMLYWLCGFLRMSSGGFTAQAVGRHDAAAALAVLRRSLTTALLLSLAFIVLQRPLLAVALSLMQASDAVRPLVGQYFHILIYGAPAMLGSFVLAGWFLGLQDARVPMVASIMQNVVNILASLLLTQVLNWQVAGVAAGTLVAQWAGLAIYLLALRRRMKHLHAAFPQQQKEAAPPPVQREEQRLSWAHFLRVNRDIFLRTLCLVAVNVAITATGAAQGDLLLAANALLLQFFTLFSYVVDGFAYAGEALGGRFYGAGDERNFRSLTRRLFLIGCAVVAAYTAAYVWGGSAFLGLLTDDATVAHAAEAYLPYACLIPAVGLAGFLYDGLYIGATASRQMLLSALAAAGVFFLLCHVLLPPLGNAGLWLALLAFLATRGAAQALMYRTILPTTAASRN